MTPSELVLLPNASSDLWNHLQFVPYQNLRHFEEKLLLSCVYSTPSKLSEILCESQKSIYFASLWERYANHTELSIGDTNSSFV